MQELSSIIFNSLSDGLFLALSMHATEFWLFPRRSKCPGNASLWTHSLRGTLRRWALSSGSALVNQKFTPSVPKSKCFPTACCPGRTGSTSLSWFVSMKPHYQSKVWTHTSEFLFLFTLEIIASTL